MTDKSARKELREKRRFKSFFKLLHNLEKTIFRVIYPYERHGNFSKYHGPLILIGNHYSYIDVAFPLRTTDDPVYFIAKQDLVKSPLLRWLLKRAHCILVKRDGSDVQALKDCMRILHGGGIISLFPEGTRNHSYKDILPFKSGAAALSIKTRTPIVPVVKITRARLFRKIHVVYGDPIEFKKYYGKKVTREQLEECDEMLRASMQNIRLAFLERHHIKIKSDKV